MEHILVATCNRTTIGRIFNVSCPRSRGAMKFHEFSSKLFIGSTNVTDKNGTYRDEDRSKMNGTENVHACSSNELLTFSVECGICVLIIIMSLGWRLARSKEKHYYDDWVYSFLTSGLLTLTFHAALIEICSSGNGEAPANSNKSTTRNRPPSFNKVSLHTGLVLASISTLSLLFVNSFFLYYIIPKNPFVCGVVHIDPESRSIRRGRRRSSAHSVLSNGVNRSNSFEIRKAKKLIQ